MLEKKIVLTNKYGEDEADALAKELGLSPLLVEVLLRRGINNSEEIKTFLYGCDEPFHDPFLLKDMGKTVQRIWQAIIRKEEITVYGDYDVDGITASSLLYLFLKNLGADVGLNSGNTHLCCNLYNTI